MLRRGFLTALAGAFVAPDPDKLLWRPGARLISVPSKHRLILADYWQVLSMVCECPNALESYKSKLTIGPSVYAACHLNSGMRPIDTKKVEDYARREVDKTYKYAYWVVYGKNESISGTIKYA